MRYLFIILFLATSGFTEIREKSVFGFQGGLVNSVANSLMKDNMALVLENFDVTDIGLLKRRPGMQNHYLDSAASDFQGEAIEGLFTYFTAEKKSLFTFRTNPAHYTNDTGSANLNLITICDDALTFCTTVVYDGFYQYRRNRDLPYNISRTHWVNNLYIASTKGELVFWDGNSMSPSRPLGPGQPEAFVMDGDGNVNGTYTYKYVFIDTIANDTTRFSSPSWEIQVLNGKVLLVIPPVADTVNHDIVKMWRKHRDSSLFRALDTIATKRNDSLLYVDNTAESGAGGDSDNLVAPEVPNGLLTTAVSPFTESPTAPGGFTIVNATVGNFNVSIIKGLESTISLEQVRAHYSIAFIDSAGRESYASPFMVTQWGTAGTPMDSLWEVQLSNIPVPPSNIDSISIRRTLGIKDQGIFDSEDAIYKVGTIAAGVTVFTDRTNWDAGETFYIFSQNEKIGAIHWGAPELTNYDDSNINFQPTDIVIFGSRAFSIGNPNFRNRLYYSHFGKPTTWPSDNFHNLFSDEADWLVGLASLGERLLAFRQNSVMQLTGLTFYQFNITPIINGVGLTGRRTLQTGLNDIFFAHTTGVYQFSRFSGIGKIPISVPIQNTVDSVKDKIQRSAGHLVENEYWWSVANGTEANNQTLIYAQVPIPHWKSYSFAVESIVPFDFDTLAPDFKTNRFIMLRENDSLYRWGYEDTATTDAGVTFEATYQSKYYFEAPGRERIHYIDLYGSGSATDMVIIFYKNYGEGLAGIPFDSVTFSPNFDDGKIDRVKVDAVVENFSIRIHDNGTGGYQLRGYNIGWQPWDKGKI